MDTVQTLTEVLVPRGQPMTQVVDPERLMAIRSGVGRMREMVRLYNENGGHALLACSGCVTLIPHGAVFALHFNPIRMIGEVHCRACYEDDPPALQARFILVKEIDDA
jgi:hypothetical protein